MNIDKMSNYFNRIMRAVVVNDDSTQDPLHKNRYQIYIPSLQPNFSADYKNYMSSSNKASDSQRSRYPWAYSTITDLKTGNIVFINCLNNDSSDYLILGLDVSGNMNTSEGYGGDNPTPMSIGSSDILALTMPIILYNEVSLPMDAYPDNISNDFYGYINCNDNYDGWSIGLLQWHKTRAYGLLYEIAKNDPNWKSKWPVEEQAIIKDIEASLAAGSITDQQGNYLGAITKNSTRYRGTYNMLTSDAGKTTQVRLAERDTYAAIQDMQENHNITNPAMLIYTADILNQGYSGAPRTKAMAKQLSATSDDMMTQFEKFVDWCKVEYGYWDTKIDGSTHQDTYWARRKRTYSYIVELYKQGKLSMGVDLTSIGAPIASSSHIPELGTYLWPLKDCDYITCTYGPQQGEWDYTFNYNTKHHHKGYHNNGGRFHYGVDYGCGEGAECIAVGDGLIAGAGWSDSAGYYVSIQMDKNKSHYFCYMHLRKQPSVSTGDRVKAGQVVGYSGNTGASQGAHLHLGLHIGSIWATRDESGRIDPLPYLGKRISN